MVGVRGVRAGRLLAVSVMLGVGMVGMVGLSAPAGAAGRDHGLRRTFTATSSRVRSSGVRSAGAHGIAPLTKFVGTTYTTDQNGNPLEIVTPAITNLRALGTTSFDGVPVTAALEGDLPGNTGNPLLEIGIVTPGNAPLQAGTVYSTDTGSTFWVNYLGSMCQPGVGGASGTPGAVKVDQVAYTAGVPTVLAFQFDFVCDFGGLGSPEFVGTAAVNITPTTPGQGYYLFDSYGGLGGFGNDSYLNYLGDLTQLNLRAPVVAMATTPSGAGYWMTAGDGGVFSYGDARFYGSTGNLTLNQPVVGMAATHDGKGYWFVASDGGIFAYGDAGFYGSMGGSPLNKPIVGMAATADGKGYWLVASDGGVFSFGDAAFHGSAGNLPLVQPVVGMASTSDGKGYWLVASDGGVFAYGDAGFYGSTGNLQLTEPVVGMTTAPDNKGYWFTASDGGVFAFGSAPFDGSLGGQGYTDIVGMAR